VANIERDSLPLADGSADLIIANQVLEHTKEIFWIFHEVSRSLKIGGHFLFGVPNICSLHNRLLLLFGRQPTQHKLCSAHVRPFSKGDTLAFLNACFPGGYRVEKFRGGPILPISCALIPCARQCFPDIRIHNFLLDPEGSGVSRRICHLPKPCSTGDQLLDRTCRHKLSVLAVAPTRGPSIKFFGFLSKMKTVAARFLAKATCE
jgi:SAM-dependent methyltransferase